MTIQASSEEKTLLKARPLNNWHLFWLISITLSSAMLIAMGGRDMSRAENVSAMIQYSVRWAVPWLYLAFAASSLHSLFPGSASRWLLRNRKSMGLCFASAMAWQLLFILWLISRHGDYYLQEVYVLRDAIEGLLGYLLLFAMTVTSFKFGRRRLSAKQWKLLHTGGIYFLWAYAFSVYWYELFYYDAPDPIDYIYYWAGLLAWALRVAAWCKKRLQKAGLPRRRTRWQWTQLQISILVMSAALVAAIQGSYWTGSAHQHLFGLPFATYLDLYFPYWPFIPFLPLMIALAGAGLLLRSRA